MIYSSIFLSTLLIIYYIIFIMLYNLFIILIKIIYIYIYTYTYEKKSPIKRRCKEKKIPLGILNLCTGFCRHLLIIIHVVELWRYY